MSLQCEFCEQCFSSKSSLSNHKLKTKYCLEIQKQQGVIESINRTEYCTYCNKSFLQRITRQTHENVCKDKDKNKIINYENEILKYKEQITERDNQIKEYDIRLKKYDQRIIEYEEVLNKMSRDLDISNEKVDIYKSMVDNRLNKTDDLIAKISLEKSIITNNNTSNTNNNSNNVSSASSSTSNKQINNISASLDLSSAKLKEAAGNYTIAHYESAEEGLVQWAIDFMLKDKDGNLLYHCSDKNRRIFIYKSSTGDTIFDPNATQLKQAIGPALLEQLKLHKKSIFAKLNEGSDDDDNSKTDACFKLHESNKTLGVAFEKELARKTYISKR